MRDSNDPKDAISFKSKSSDYSFRPECFGKLPFHLPEYFCCFQVGSHYCQECAYKKGICAMCGVKILKTKNYKQSST